MHSQTIDQLLPILQLIQQPAFCIRQDGSVVCNHTAGTLAPCSGQAVSQWLGDSADVYASWDRSGALVLPVPLAGITCSVTIQPLADGELFLLSQCEHIMAGSEPMAVAAQVIRQPLSELTNALQELSDELYAQEDPLLLDYTASMTRQLYRLNRITCNLADLEQLRSGTYRPRLEKVELLQFLQEFSTEMEDICSMTGRSLRCTLPTKPILVYTDSMLLERAILNLLSNAMKYGRTDNPIEFRVEAAPNAVLFRMRNACSDENSDLLRAAFQRLTQRGVLPDPQWGIGLGLPMSRYIAQQLGGTVAVEVTADHMASVTLSIRRMRSLPDHDVQMLPLYDYTGGMRHSLVELSDSLPDDCFNIAAL